MGELDLREKKLLSKNDVFAAFLTAFVIDRDEAPISTDELSEASHLDDASARESSVSRRHQVFAR